MQFVEYRPSMVGIPTDAVARLYDRLDAEALRTEASANKVQMALANQIAQATDGDKAYLQDLKGKIDSIMEQASTEKNLPGYSKQIRKLVADISGSPEFATVRNNSRLAEEWRKTDMQLATQYGRENIVQSGDNPATFSSFGPNGELRQFQGFSTKRPDYLKGMDDVFMRNVDIVQDMKSLEGFINNQEAFANYTKTPEGRVHINELSQSMFGVPFDRLPTGPADEFGNSGMSQEQAQVIQKMNSMLHDAGVRYIKTAQAKTAVPARYKDLEGKGIITSGIANQSLTDGTDATDATIGVISDRVDNSELDDQLTQLVAYDRDLILYPDASSGVESVERGQAIQSKQIRGSQLTTQKGPNGRPLIQVEYNLGNKDDSERGIGYYELSQEDLPHVQQAMAGTLMQLRSNATTDANRGTAVRALVNIFNHDLNAWEAGDKQKPYRYENANGAYEVRAVPEGYAMYDEAGNAIVKDGKQLVYDNYNSVTRHVGYWLLNNL